MKSSSSSSSRSSNNSRESALVEATGLQLERAFNKAAEEEDNSEDDNISEGDVDDNNSEDDADTEENASLHDNEIKLPNLSFGYYYGPSLQTMHTSVMLMLSGCPGGDVVERVNARTIERTFDLSNSLLLNPNEYNKHLGRLETSKFMEAFRIAASEKEASLSGDGYPSVVALSLVEGEQGIDPIAICGDVEVHSGDDDNPSVFSHVELVSGAMRHHSALSSPLNESAFKSADRSSISKGKHSAIVPPGSEETAILKQAVATIELDVEPLLAHGVSTESNDAAAVDEYEIEIQFEIEFTDNVDLFWDAWNYPSRIAMVFDD